MAAIKKNQLTQVLFTLVDKVDMASIESGITSNFTQRLWGVKHGVSTAAVAKTPSKTPSVVRSGVFRATLKNTEVSDFDFVWYQVTHASAADQNMFFEARDNDDSDLMSMMALIQSLASDAHSAAAQANSRVLLVQSRISDAQSFLSDLHSDLLSYLAGMSGMLSDTYSNLSDFKSDFQSRVPKLVATNSQLSDLHSDLLSYLTGISGTLSDVDSALTSSFSNLLSLVTVTGVQLNASTMSDIRSAIAGVTATVSASDISDIASAVRAALVSDLSDILSAAQQTNSRALVNQSRVSDIASFLVVMSGVQSDLYSALSDLQSDFGSRVPKRVATDSQLSDVHSDLASKIGAITASVSASDISDIASAVWANTIGTRVDSRVLLIQSRVSDAQSILSDFYSDFQSRVPKRVATESQLSEVHSDLASKIGGITAAVSASDISDIASAVWAHTVGTRVDSRVLLNLSRISDVYSLLSDAHSDLRSLLTTTGIALDASTMSDLRSAITAGGGALTTSNISDIASAVYAILGSDLSDIYSGVQQTNSRALVIQSHASNIYSLLSDVASDITVMSGVLSDAYSGIVALSDAVSNAYSAAVQANSRALVIQSQTSDIYSLLSDVSSDLGVMSGVMSDVYSLLSDFDSDFESRFPATIAELTTDPGATPTWAQAEALQFMWLRNNSKSTSTKRFLRNNAGTTVLSATQSDDGTSYLQGKLG